MVYRFAVHTPEQINTEAAAFECLLDTNHGFGFRLWSHRFHATKTGKVRAPSQRLGAALQWWLAAKGTNLLVRYIGPATRSCSTEGEQIATEESLCDALTQFAGVALVTKAEVTIRAVFKDTSVPVATTRERLEALAEHIQEMLTCLKDSP